MTPCVMEFPEELHKFLQNNDHINSCRIMIIYARLAHCEVSCFDYIGRGSFLYLNSFKVNFFQGSTLFLRQTFSIGDPINSRRIMIIYARQNNYINPCRIMVIYARQAMMSDSSRLSMDVHDLPLLPFGMKSSPGRSYAGEDFYIFLLFFFIFSFGMKSSPGRSFAGDELHYFHFRN